MPQPFVSTPNICLIINAGRSFICQRIQQYTTSYHPAYSREVETLNGKIPEVLRSLELNRQIEDIHIGLSETGLIH